MDNSYPIYKSSQFIMDSSLMYYGFKHTKAVTYDECINQIFGRKIGLFANIVVFIHVFGAVVSTWIFSYIFCDKSLQKIFGNFSSMGSDIFKYSFFGVTLIIMFASVSFANIDKLKFIAIIGFLILIYLVILFMAYTPKYFNHFNSDNEFQLEGVIMSTFIFKTYGLTQYIFLNQYSIIPLCNNVKDVSFRRIKKVIFRAISVLFVIYFCVMITGYFSQPSISRAKEKLTELFILRPSVDGSKEVFLTIGQTLFGITLFIANLVKSQFFIIYFHQIVKNIRVLYQGGTRNELLQQRLLSKENSKTTPEKVKQLKRSKSAGRCIKFNVPKKLPLLNETSESKETSENEEPQEENNQFIQISIHKPGEQDNQTQEEIPRKRNLSFSKENLDDQDQQIMKDQSEEQLPIIKEEKKPGSILKNPSKENVFKTDYEGQLVKPKSEKKLPSSKIDWKKVGINAIVMIVTVGLTLTLMNSLSTFLSLIGNFVGVFEIFVFPFAIVIILNKRKKIVSNLHLVGI